MCVCVCGDEEATVSDGDIYLYNYRLSYYFFMCGHRIIIIIILFVSHGQFVIYDYVSVLLLYNNIILLCYH